LVLVLVACGAGIPEVDVQVSPLAFDSPVSPDPPTAAAEPTLAPMSTPAPTVTPASALTPAPAQIELVVLHTNDNWGETEPCG
jgi:hypothetical protein